MKRYIAKRILMFLLVLIGVSMLSFALVEAFGNDPAEIIVRRGNIRATYEQIEEMRRSMGLDKPLPVRYLNWIRGMFAGDVGLSIYSFKPVMEDISVYFPTSLKLVGMAMLWILVLFLPVSLLCARFRDSVFDHAVRLLSIVGLSFPAFWLGFLLLIAFAVKLSWFTVTPASGIRGYVLPAFALALPVASAFIRIFRSALLKEMSSDYAQYARARGLSPGRILTAHAVRNALPPIVTLSCQYLGYLIAGAVVVENVFSVGGIGAYLIGCVTAADSTATATCVVIIAAVFVVANLAGDLINRLLCPWMVKEYNA